MAGCAPQEWQETKDAVIMSREEFGEDPWMGRDNEILEELKRSPMQPEASV